MKNANMVMETGFFLVLNSDENAEKYQNILIGGVEERIGSFYLKYKELQRFQDDHVRVSNDDYFLLLDGVILNKKELLVNSNLTWADFIFKKFLRNITDAINELRGSFRGFIINKHTFEVHLFTNQTGEKTVYYMSCGKNFIAASNTIILAQVMKADGMQYDMNTDALRELLCIGATISGKTPIRDVYRLMAGRLLRRDFSDGAVRVEKYHYFENGPEIKENIETCIEELDRRYRKAVSRIFEKSKEYGYQAECDLSGGLDSRMVAWVAKNLGYEDIIAVSYCQSNSLDHKISRKLAKDLGFEYIFIPLDDGKILTEVDSACKKFSGQVTYIICTGSVKAVDMIRGRNVGLMAMGLWGEALKADLTESGYEHTNPGNILVRYSNVIPFEYPDSVKREYQTYEQMGFYEYGVPLIISSTIARQDTVEAISPNMDVDLLEYIYRIPLKYRKDYLIFEKWIVDKYPGAAEYVWTTVREPVSFHYKKRFYLPKTFHKLTTLGKRLLNKAAQELKIPFQLPLYYEMHPMQAWYIINKELRQFISQYYRDNIRLVEDKTLRDMLNRTYQKGKAYDKVQVLNVLAINKLFLRI